MKTNKIQSSLFLLPMIFTITISAQNLVPNPSFESYSQCPTIPWNMFDCNNWINVIPGNAASYYNACYNGQGQPAGVPLNWLGYQEA